MTGPDAGHARSSRPSRFSQVSRAAAIGIMTTGAVGFVFINGLSASTASAPLAVAVGLMCASEPRPGRAETAKPTS